MRTATTRTATTRTATMTTATTSTKLTTTTTKTAKTKTNFQAIHLAVICNGAAKQKTTVYTRYHSDNKC
jgi:hypothetical protein